MTQSEEFLSNSEAGCIPIPVNIQLKAHTETFDLVGLIEQEVILGKMFLSQRNKLLIRL
jgi:hypothetical protein